MLSFDLIELQGPTCGRGHPYLYPPAIEEGSFVTAACRPCGEEGVTIDDFMLRCEDCDLYVSLSYGACPNDPAHGLNHRDA